MLVKIIMEDLFSISHLWLKAIFQKYLVYCTPFFIEYPSKFLNVSVNLFIGCFLICIILSFSFKCMELKGAVFVYNVYRCIPCPAGHYVDPNTTSCHPCPNNEVIRSRLAWGEDSCVKCGPGLLAKEGTMCVSDCIYTDDANRKYDFTALKR